MALMKIEPTNASVAWDARLERPGSIVAGSRRLRVLALTVRRDEIAAFRADRGPRITYHLATDGCDLARCFDARRRTWYIEAVDELALAA